MPGLHSRLEYLSRLLARCKWNKICTNVDIHILVRGLSITRQDIRDILISFNSGLIYRHVSESFETRREQVESVEDEANIPFMFLSCLVLSRRESKPVIVRDPRLSKDLRILCTDSLLPYLYEKDKTKSETKLQLEVWIRSRGDN